MKVAFVVI